MGTVIWGKGRRVRESGFMIYGRVRDKVFMVCGIMFEFVRLFFSFWIEDPGLRVN
jgi:hypothetical protein